MRLPLLQLAVPALFLFLSACSAGNPSQAVRLGAPVSMQASLVWLTQDLELFSQAGVTVELHSYPSGKRALEALLRGEVELAIVAETPFAIAAGSQPDLRLFTTLGKSDNDVRILARRDHGIEQPADLAGKVVATQEGSAVHFFLSSFLLYHGLEEERLRIRFLEAEELAPALVRGEVDAISMRDPVLEEAKRALGGERSVEMGVPGLYTKTYNLVGLERLTITRPGVLEKILVALINAEKFLEQHPQRARKLIARRLGLPESHLRLLWSGLQFRVALGQGLLVTLQEEAEWAMARSGTVGSMPDFLSLLDIGPLSRVAPDAVGVIGLEPGG